MSEKEAEEYTANLDECRTRDLISFFQRSNRMKTELKRKIFDSAASLCNFVNKCNITKENIQSIIENSDIFFLFYWEVTV